MNGIGSQRIEISYKKTRIITPSPRNITAPRPGSALGLARESFCSPSGKDHSIKCSILWSHAPFPRANCFVAAKAD